MGKRFALVPLDSRPVNTDLPGGLAAAAGCKLFQPPNNILGKLKNPADRDALRGWLKERFRNGLDTLIVSLDALAYGGLVQSREPVISYKQAVRNLDFLRSLKRKYPETGIFAFGTVMRDAVTAVDEKSLKVWRGQMKGGGRPGKSVSPARKRNFDVNMLMIEWAADGVFDFLALGKEDTAAGNPNSFELRLLGRAAAAAGNVSVQTGADELAQLMLARAVARDTDFRPAFFIDASKEMLSCVPLYEPGRFGANLRKQINCCGGKIVKGPQAADVIIVPWMSGRREDMFLVQLGGGELRGRAPRRDWFDKIEKYIGMGKCVGVVDASFLNGSDPRLVEELLERELFFSLGAYAGWNTVSNSSGTVVAQALVAASTARAGRSNSETCALVSLLLNRLVEDYIYSCKVRGALARRMSSPMKLSRPGQARALLEDGLRAEYRAVLRRSLVGKRLKPYGASGWAPEVTCGEIKSARLPWDRLFEARSSPAIHIKD